MGINILHGFSKRDPNNSARRPAFIVRGKLFLHRNTSDLRCADIPYLSAVLSQAYHMIRQAAHQPGFFLLYARIVPEIIFFVRVIGQIIKFPITPVLIVNQLLMAVPDYSDS